MASLNDLLANLERHTERVAPRSRPETWRIHFVVPSASKLLRDDGALLSALAEEGFKVHVIAHDEGAFEQLERRGVITCALPRCEPLARGLLLAPLIYPILQGHLIEHAPALIHVEQEPLISLCALASKLLDEPPALIATLRGRRAPPSEALLELSPRLLAATAATSRLERRYWSYLGEHVEAFLATSRFELQGLINDTPFPNAKLELWQGGSGYDASHFDPDRADLPTKQELREMAGVPKRWTTLIGLAGDLGRSDAELLSLVITRLERLAPEAGWVIAKTPGSPLPEPLKPHLNGRLLALEPGEHGMPLFMALSDLWCSARRTERLDMSALEAGAMGAPCVAFKTRHHRALLSSPEAARLIRLPAPDEPMERAAERLAEPLAALVKDDALRAEMSARAKRAARTSSRRAAHAQLMTLYDRVLSRRYT